MAIGWASLARPAQATVAVTLIGPISPSQFDRNNTFGWRCRPTIDVDVTSLGYFDQTSLSGGSGSGLVQSHDVGIFSPDTTLVAVVTVPAGTAGTLIGNFRYVDLTQPVRLTAGTTYTIGAFYLSISPDAIPGMSTPGASSWSFPPEIAYANNPLPTPQNLAGGTGQYVVSVQGSPPHNLSCPQLALTNTAPFFSSNFQFMVPCALPGDMNSDGVIDGKDIQHFVNCKLSGGSTPGECACANMSEDSFVTLLLG